MNKKILLVLAFLLGLASQVFPQKIEFSPYAGYMLAGKFNANRGEIDIKNGGNFGATLSFNLSNYTFEDNTHLELMYNHLNTYVLRREYGSGITKRLFDMNVDYYQIGVTHMVVPDGMFRPFGSISLGWSTFNPKESGVSSESRFSMVLGGGAKVFFTDHIGIRVQGRLLMPMYFSGGGLWCGTGGCSAGLAASSVVPQGDFTGGLIFAF
ncbi:outer membrane beta-barrel protein [Flammeovirgaceae bacterium SG7u.111]|nr:outer membrane beta-barrel protein [Flammeovirgaceae bacterium SG7u.132]WPO35633.1 outer membrane beta-barrel protein [Flammeovirgaceae bacterium SG7u.111]